MAQNKTVKHIVSEITGKTVVEIDKAALIAYIQIMLSAGRMVYNVIS